MLAYRAICRGYYHEGSAEEQPGQEDGGLCLRHMQCHEDSLGPSQGSYAAADLLWLPGPRVVVILEGHLQPARRK